MGQRGSTMVDAVTVARDAAKRWFEDANRKPDEVMATPEFRALLQREMTWQFAWAKQHKVPNEHTQGLMMVAGGAAAEFYLKQELKKT